MQNKQFLIETHTISQVLAWGNEQIKELAPVEEKAIPLQIAFEEIVANLFEHAYPEGKGPIEVAVWKDGAVVVEICDEAAAFNPLEHVKEPLDPNTPTEELRIGGLGLLLVVKLMDQVEYKRDGSKNRLLLKKKI